MCPYLYRWDPGWKYSELTEIAQAIVSNKACKSVSLSNFAFTISSIALLYKSRGLTDCCAGACSLVICVSDGGGGGVVVFYFFS